MQLSVSLHWLFPCLILSIFIITFPYKINICLSKEKIILSWNDWNKNEIKRNSQKQIVIENHVCNQIMKAIWLVTINQVMNQVVFWIIFITIFSKIENIEYHVEYFGWFTNIKNFQENSYVFNAFCVGITNWGCLFQCDVTILLQKFPFFDG